MGLLNHLPLPKIEFHFSLCCWYCEKEVRNSSQITVCSYCGYLFCSNCGESAAAKVQSDYRIICPKCEMGPDAPETAKQLGYDGPKTFMLYLRLSAKSDEVNSFISAYLKGRELGFDKCGDETQFLLSQLDKKRFRTLCRKLAKILNDEAIGPNLRIYAAQLLEKSAESLSGIRARKALRGDKSLLRELERATLSKDSSVAGYSRRIQKTMGIRETFASPYGEIFQRVEDERGTRSGWRTCSRCGREYSLSKCPYCDESQPQPSSRSGWRICPKCGREFSTPKCPRCGN